MLNLGGPRMSTSPNLAAGCGNCLTRAPRDIPQEACCPAFRCTEAHAAFGHPQELITGFLPLFPAGCELSRALFASSSLGLWGVDGR